MSSIEIIDLNTTDFVEQPLSGLNNLSDSEDFDKASLSSVGALKKYFVCTECRKGYQHHQSFKKHVKKCHPYKFECMFPSQHSCKNCGSKFNNISHLQSHGCNESSTCSSKYVCIDCNKSYARQQGLNAHMRRFHPSKIDIPLYYSCGECDKQLKNKTCLKIHMRKEHSKCKTNNKGVKCPLCQEVMEKNIFDKHCNLFHDINIDIEKLQFSSTECFNIWKERIEKETKSSFVKKKSDIKDNTGCVKSFFQCHRSGIYTSRGQGARHLKIQGSNKINSYCPAGISVSKHNDDYQVTFIKTHVGHEFSLSHLYLTVEERQALAGKIASRIPYNAILDDIKDSITSNELERLHLLTRKDLFNIEREFNIGSSIMRHNNDSKSVDSWVNEMGLHENSCVLFYKPQDGVVSEYPGLLEKDFVLIIMNTAQSELLNKYGSDCICLDDTHGTNGYNFSLTTLLVLDDMRQGFPCAFLISSRSDEYVLKLFFEKIKLKCGLISPRVFMSDMAETFYNAWICIMEPAEMRLFCTWHVDRAWRKNLRKIKSPIKQAETYKLLRTVLEERDVKAFDKMLPVMLNILYNDPETIEFGHYFNDQYVKRKFNWAYCYRLHAGINTNMHVERMHKTIKYIYLQAKSVRRLDKAITAIMRFVKDKMMDRLVSLYKGKLTNKFTNLRYRHKTSIDLHSTVIKTEEGWNIQSSDSCEIYSLCDNVQDCKCKLICEDCRACIHRYTCTCLDSAIKWNMCKHIHKVCKFILDEQACQTIPIEASSNLCIIEDNETDFLLNEIKSTNLINSERDVHLKNDEKKRKLKEKLCKTVDSLQSSEEIDAVEKLVAPIQPTINAIKNEKNSRHFVSKDSNLKRKNITPQRRLFSVKKVAETKKGLSIKKPSKEESENLSLFLLTKK